MAQTNVPATTSAYTIPQLNSPRAVKKWSAILAEDVNRKSWFTSKFMGKGEDTTRPIMMLTDLEADNGEEIGFDLSVQLRQRPIEGDNVQEGTEEDLTFYTDSVLINQMRGGVPVGSIYQ